MSRQHDAAIVAAAGCLRGAPGLAGRVLRCRHASFGGRVGRGLEAEDGRGIA